MKTAVTFRGLLRCHLVSPGAESNAPSLYGICGRRIASTDFDQYSRALFGVSGVWDTETLAKFINDPQAFAPDNTMQWPALDDAELSASIAQVLCPDPL